jgi:hypothetical protein
MLLGLFMITVFHFALSDDIWHQRVLSFIFEMFFLIMILHLINHTLILYIHLEIIIFTMFIFLIIQLLAIINLRSILVIKVHLFKVI